MGLLEGGEGVPDGVLAQDDRQDRAQHQERPGGVPGDEEADGGQERAERGGGQDGEDDGGTAGAPGLLPSPRLRTSGCPVYAPETPSSTVKTR